MCVHTVYVYLLLILSLHKYVFLLFFWSWLLGYLKKKKRNKVSRIIKRFKIYLKQTCSHQTRSNLLVSAPNSSSKSCEFESRQERRENFLFQSYFCVLTLIRCPFHLRVTAVARKRPRSFYQKYRWQVTPNHAYTLDPTKSEWGDHAAVQK